MVDLGGWGMVKILKDHIGDCLEQIKWARYHKGEYSSSDPILITQKKLRAIRDDKEAEPLNVYDIALLLESTRLSQNHFLKCKYEGRTVMPETKEKVDQLHTILYKLFVELMGNELARD